MKNSKHSNFEIWTFSYINLQSSLSQRDYFSLKMVTTIKTSWTSTAFYNFYSTALSKIKNYRKKIRNSREFIFWGLVIDDKFYRNKLFKKCAFQQNLPNAGNYNFSKNWFLLNKLMTFLVTKLKHIIHEYI